MLHDLNPFSMFQMEHFRRKSKAKKEFLSSSLREYNVRI